MVGLPARRPRRPARPRRDQRGRRPADARELRDGLPLLPGALETVRALAARWPLGLASSSNREIIDVFLERSAGSATCFGATVSSEQVDRGKPAPDVYLETARRLDVDPRSCVAIEDSANGLRAAHAAGMPVIAAPNPHYPPGDDALALARRGRRRRRRGHAGAGRVARVARSSSSHLPPAEMTAMTKKTIAAAGAAALLLGGGATAACAAVTSQGPGTPRITEADADLTRSGLLRWRPRPRALRTEGLGLNGDARAGRPQRRDADQPPGPRVRRRPLQHPDRPGARRGGRRRRLRTRRGSQDREGAHRRGRAQDGGAPDSAA